MSEFVASSWMTSARPLAAFSPTPIRGTATLTGWTDWSTEAQALYGINRGHLDTVGVHASGIVDEMVKTRADLDLYASAPSWDGKWLSALLRTAEHAPHQRRLGKTDDAFLTATEAVLGSSVPEKELADLVNDVIARSEPAALAHQALPDELLELGRWNLVRAEAVARRGHQGTAFSRMTCQTLFRHG